jgi:hypothetical protein
MHRVLFERPDDRVNRRIVEDDVSRCGNPRLVSVAEYSIGDWGLELERAAKDDDAVQQMRIDAEKFLERLNMAVVLVKRILKLELLLEVDSCPVSVSGVPEYPACPILQLNDKDSKSRHDEVVDLCRTARRGNDDPVKMVILRAMKLKWSVGKVGPKSSENSHG